MKKIRLNDEQWLKLTRLVPAPRRLHGRIPEAVRSSTRLSSHGLICSDETGQEFLTELGQLRLRQGR
ncbi:hypothetical protein QTI51_37160 [Variovorax sp. J22G73]|uniref:hypothetical protein n=1 Tax=unclassified Variovorax TaxID=663243 RepID=UPI0025759039|nr:MULTISPECIES: hypothetical protein [unclassified Variovorax]MDM0010182.1 hypothetical protein [Variovorax sp. J22R203]MDM0102956.1 hypothetical protein [Variovorax sp. J22G73]